MVVRKQRNREYVLSDAAARWAVRRYNNGNGPSIRQLAGACGVSYTTMNTALDRAGVTKRRTGRPALRVVR